MPRLIKIQRWLRNHTICISSARRLLHSWQSKQLQTVARVVFTTLFLDFCHGKSLRFLTPVEPRFTVYSRWISLPSNVPFGNARAGCSDFSCQKAARDRNERIDRQYRLRHARKQNFRQNEQSLLNLYTNFSRGPASVKSQREVYQRNRRFKYFRRLCVKRWESTFPSVRSFILDFVSG